MDSSHEDVTACVRLKTHRRLVNLVNFGEQFVTLSLLTSETSVVFPLLVIELIVILLGLCSATATYHLGEKEQIALVLKIQFLFIFNVCVFVCRSVPVCFSAGVIKH